jgi:hypothetical protein
MHGDPLQCGPALWTESTGTEDPGPSSDGISRQADHILTAARQTDRRLLEMEVSGVVLSSLLGPSLNP